MEVQIFSDLFEYPKPFFMENKYCYDSNFNKVRQSVMFFPGSLAFGKRTYFIIVEDNRVIASLLLRYSESGYKGYHRKRIKYLLSFISVSSSHSGKGLASKLLEEMFLFCKQHKISGVSNSKYSKDGLKYIAPKVKRLSKQYPEVDFYNSID